MGQDLEVEESVLGKEKARSRRVRVSRKFRTSTNPGGKAVGLESAGLSYMLCRKFCIEAIHRYPKRFIRKDTVVSVYLKDNRGRR